MDMNKEIEQFASVIDDRARMKLKIKELEDKLNEVIETVIELESYIKNQNAPGTWHWKDGYLDDNGNWVKGRWL